MSRMNGSREDPIAVEIMIYLNAVSELTIVFTRKYLMCANNLTFEPVFFDDMAHLDACIEKIRKEIPEIRVMEWK